MWLVAETVDGLTLEFWPRQAIAPSVVLEVATGLTMEQWSLIKQQFNNMGIVPRPANGKA